MYTGWYLQFPTLINLNGSFELVNNDIINIVIFDMITEITDASTLTHSSNPTYLSMGNVTKFGAVTFDTLPKLQHLYQWNNALTISNFTAADLGSASNADVLNEFWSYSSSYIRSLVIKNSGDDDGLVYSLNTFLGNVLIDSPGTRIIGGIIKDKRFSSIVTPGGLSSLVFSTLSDANILIIRNTSLKFFAAPSLTSLGDSIGITDNQDLTHFELSGLQQVFGNMINANNTVLQDISFPSLVLIESLILEGNFSLLPYVELERL